MFCADESFYIFYIIHMLVEEIMCSMIVIIFNQCDYL